MMHLEALLLCVISVISPLPYFQVLRPRPAVASIQKSGWLLLTTREYKLSLQRKLEKYELKRPIVWIQVLKGSLRRGNPRLFTGAKRARSELGRHFVPYKLELVLLEGGSYKDRRTHGLQTYYSFESVDLYAK
jgi:hypothetical protein